MNPQKDKVLESKSKSAALVSPPTPNDGTQLSHFSDNRKEAVSQRRFAIEG